jgi:aminopeptidase N
MYNQLAADGDYRNDQDSINRRRLKNVVLGYLATLQQPDIAALVRNQFDAADNMTDKQAALAVFYDEYAGEPLVVDKWFTVQARSRRSDTINAVRQLTRHKDFSIENPNRVRSLLGAFTSNQVHFHCKDGSGYKLLTDFVLQIEANNPQLAARLVGALNSYRRFDSTRQSMMESELQRIDAHPGLCKDVREIVQRALNF